MVKIVVAKVKSVVARVKSVVTRVKSVVSRVKRLVARVKSVVARVKSAIAWWRKKNIQKKISLSLTLGQKFDLFWCPCRLFWGPYKLSKASSDGGEAI